MDAVIAYVNNSDPLWIGDLMNNGYKNYDSSRYRDYGLLKYLIRGINKFMPYIDNIYVLISRNSQKPSWASDKIKFVLHREFIPNKFLPTFNSCTIECFLPLIEGLSEQFVYFNDDMYVIGDVKLDELFLNDLPVIRTNCLAFNCIDDMYILLTKNSQDVAFSALEKVFDYYGMYHRPTPLIKSICLECFELNKEAIYNSCSLFREKKNVNQYIYPFYHIYKNKAKHIYGIGDYYYEVITDIDKIKRDFRLKKHNLITLNDSEIRSLTKEENEIIIELFEKLLPDKSKYEN